MVVAQNAVGSEHLLDNSLRPRHFAAGCISDNTAFGAELYDEIRTSPTITYRLREPSGSTVGRDALLLGYGTEAFLDDTVFSCNPSSGLISVADGGLLQFNGTVTVHGDQIGTGTHAVAVYLSQNGDTPWMTMQDKSCIATITNGSIPGSRTTSHMDFVVPASSGDTFQFKTLVSTTNPAYRDTLDSSGCRVHALITATFLATPTTSASGRTYTGGVDDTYVKTDSADGWNFTTGAGHRIGVYDTTVGIRTCQMTFGAWEELVEPFDPSGSGNFGRYGSFNTSGTVMACEFNNTEVRVYDYSDDSGWTERLGSVSIGGTSNLNSIILTHNGQRLGLNDTVDDVVRVFDYSNTSNDWIQVGSTLDVSTNASFHMDSASGMTVFVGAPFDTSNGAILVYDFSGSDWQLRSTIRDSGASGILYMGLAGMVGSEDGTRIAAYATQNTTFYRVAPIFYYQDGSWNQFENAISWPDADLLGATMSSDGGVAVIGNAQAKTVRVYDLDTVSGAILRAEPNVASSGGVRISTSSGGYAINNSIASKFVDTLVMR